MRVSQHGWTGYRGAHSPAPLLLLYVLYAPLSLFLLATPPLAQGAIQIPKGLSQPPVMSEMPESFIAFSLEDIILPCEATAIPNATFRWVKDGKEFGPERTGSGTWFAEGEEPLSFYQGVYRCYASNTLGTAMSPAIRLITETQPIPPKRQGSWKTAQEGDSLILPCNPPNSSSTPLIHWMDRKMVHIKQSERVVVGQDGNMYFAHVMKTDSRHKYICNAQYPDARIILPKEPISLTVTTSNDASPARKPHLFLPHGTHTSKKALKDHSLILECIPKGLPTPKVEWRKKDGSLAETGGKVDTHGRWLNFESIALEDDGEYECKATNEHGSVTHSFTVTVEAEPYWVKQPESLLYAPGETVRLECQADGIPTPAIIWNINGQPVTEVDEDPRRRASGGVLILRDVAFGDTAVYQCEATNEHGNILINTYIYVIELPPQILSNDGEVYRVAEGKVAKLPCEVFGSPLPHVTWDGEGSLPLLSDPRVALMTNGMLELSNASRDDRGAYTCTIRNTNISITAYLEVLNRTVMLAGPHHVRVFRGNSSQLDCRFYMDPQLKQPQINWKRDGHKLVLDPSKYTVLPNGTLLMTNLELKDSGQYSCEVLTEVDDVEANGIVTVIDCPEPPYGLALYDIQDRSLTLSWLLVPSHNSPITDFIVEAQEAQHTEEVQGNWEKWKHVSGDVNHLELTLQPYSKYRFRVIGVNEVGPSKPSEESESHGTPPAVPDTNPSHVRSNSLDSGTLIIEWEEMEKRKHNGPGFQYKVSWRLSEGQSQHWNHSYTLAPPFLVNGTEPYSPFEIKVQAVNTQGEGLAPIAEIGYSGEGVPLEAPGEVEVTVMNSTVRVTWEHAQRVQGLLLGYKIYIKRLGYQGERGRRALGQMHNDREREGREEEEDEESRAVEVLGMKTSAEVPGLRLYSRYEVSVAVFNSKDDGPRSQPEPFSTPEGAPGPPASLTLESPSETELTLHWTPPIQTNGILLEYIVQYQREVENKDVKMSIIRDPTRTYLELDNLDPHSGYIFKVSGRTAAGDGPPITKKGSTLLDGVPPSNITLVAGETSVNFSWVPGTRYRNHAFQFQYLRKGGTVGAQWEESDFVDTSQGFFPLIGLQPGTKYHFIITHANHTHWDQEIQTSGPELSEVAGGFATQGWFIGLISAIVLLMLILLILCFIKRSKGGKYAVKDKEEGQVDSEAKPMKDETFGEYRSLESDGDEKRTASQPSLCPESKLGSEDSLAEYGDSVDIQFNEDGSFIGQYSGRGPVPQGGNESSGPASPDNPVPPPPIAPSMSTILDRPS